MKIVFTAVMYFLLSMAAFAQQTNNELEFHYEDIENFKKVMEVVKNKGDILNAIKDYFANGSEGMKAWVNRYDVKPELILKTIQYFPSYYEYLSTIDGKLKEYEP